MRRTCDPGFAGNAARLAVRVGSASIYAVEIEREVYASGGRSSIPRVMASAGRFEPGHGEPTKRSSRAFDLHIQGPAVSVSTSPMRSRASSLELFGVPLAFVVVPLALAACSGGGDRAPQVDVPRVADAATGEDAPSEGDGGGVQDAAGGGRRGQRDARRLRGADGGPCVVPSTGAAGTGSFTATGLFAQAAPAREVFAEMISTTFLRISFEDYESSCGYNIAELQKFGASGIHVEIVSQNADAATPFGVGVYSTTGPYLIAASFDVPGTLTCGEGMYSGQLMTAAAGSVTITSLSPTVTGSFDLEIQDTFEPTATGFTQDHLTGTFASARSATRTRRAPAGAAAPQRWTTPER